MTGGCLKINFVNGYDFGIIVQPATTRCDSVARGRRHGGWGMQARE
jgi:hypothetical protein